MFVTNIRGLELKLSIVVHKGCGRCLLENLMSLLGQATPHPIGKKMILLVLKGWTFHVYSNYIHI